MKDSRQSVFSFNDKSISQYLKDISEIPLLSPNEEVKLARQIKKGNNRAFIKLVKANLRFVVSVAKEYRNQGLSMQDLINEGNLGLIRAAGRFDETKGFKFISYAVWWIRQSILQAIAENSRVVRLPLNKIGSINKITKKAIDLEQEYEREPSLEELANSMQMPTEELSKYFLYRSRQISLETTFRDNDNKSMLETIENKNAKNPDSELLKESLQEDIKKAFKSISPKEAEILKLYFGLGTDRPLTLEEIGKQFKLTRERVRQIKEKALIRLRHQSRCKSLRWYLG